MIDIIGGTIMFILAIVVYLLGWYNLIKDYKK